MGFNEMKDWYVGYKLFIYLVLNNSHKKNSFIKHVLECFSNKFQFMQINVNFLIFNYVRHWKYLKNKLNFFPLDKYQ
jgi:hypothetical protein